MAPARKKHIVEEPPPPPPPPPPDPRIFTASSETILTAIKLLDTSEVAMLSTTLTQLFRHAMVANLGGNISELSSINKKALIRQGIVPKLLNLIDKTDSKVVRRQAIILLSVLFNAQKDCGGDGSFSSVTTPSILNVLGVKQYGGFPSDEQQVGLLKQLIFLLFPSSRQQQRQSTVGNVIVVAENNNAENNKNDDQTTQEFAAMLIAKLSEDEQNAAVMLTLAVENLEFYDQLLLLLATLPTTNALLPATTEQPPVPQKPLDQQLLQNVQPNMQFHLLRTVRNLWAHPKSRALLAQRVLPPALKQRAESVSLFLQLCIQLILCDYPYLQRAAIEALETFFVHNADDPQTIDVLLTNTACATLVKLLTNSNMLDLHSAGMKALYLFLTISPQLAEQVVFSGLAKLFVQALKDQRQSCMFDVHQFCASCLAFLIASPSQTEKCDDEPQQNLEFARELHEQDIEVDLANELQFPSYDIQRASLEAVCAVCKYKMAKVRFGQITEPVNFIDMIARLMLSPKDHVREMATFAMAMLVTIDSNAQRAIRGSGGNSGLGGSAGGVPRILLNMLQSEMQRGLQAYQQQQHHLKAVAEASLKHLRKVQQHQQKSKNLMQPPEEKFKSTASTEQTKQNLHTSVTITGDNISNSENTSDDKTNSHSERPSITKQECEKINLLSADGARVEINSGSCKGKLKLLNAQAQKRIANCLACMNETQYNCWNNVHMSPMRNAALGKSNRMVAFMGKTETIRLLPYLMEPTFSDELLQRALATAGIYRQTASIKAHFLQEGGAAAVVELIRSNCTSNNIKRDACSIVCTLTTDMNVAATFLDAGILPALVQFEATVAVGDAEQNENILTSRRVLQCLTVHHVPAKWAFTSALGVDDRLENGFYDVGKLDMDPQLTTISFADFQKQPLSPRVTVIYINPGERHLDPVEKGSSEEMLHDWLRRYSSDHHQIGSLAAAAVNRNKMSMKADEAAAEKAATAAKSKNLPNKSHYDVVQECMLEDFELTRIMEEAYSIVDSDDSLTNKVHALAHVVAAAMGGSTPASEANNWSNAVHLSELKTQLDCNCIPLGMIRKGHYLHRALLFKLLADLCEDMQCAVYRGQADRCWNLVYLGEPQKSNGADDQDVQGPTLDNEQDEKTAADSAQKDQQHWFVVDLMHNVGELYQQRSWEARQYSCPERHAPLEWSVQQVVLKKTSEDLVNTDNAQTSDGLTLEGREFFAEILKRRIVRKQRLARRKTQQRSRSILKTTATDIYSTHGSFSDKITFNN